MFRYRCPQCSQPLQTQAQLAGTTTDCVICLTSHVIPQSEPAGLLVVGEPVAKRAHGGEEVQQPAPTSPPGPLPLPSTQAVTAEPADAAEPTHVHVQADLAAALTQALSQRMKPPRQPRRDLRPSTALWLILTALGLVFLLVSLWRSPQSSWWVVGLGLAQILIGYAWIVWLTSQRETIRGVTCAIPPIALYYLGQRKYAKLRPLRFVGTGVALVGVAWISMAAGPTTRGWFGHGPPHPQPAVVDEAEMSKLERVRAHQEQKQYDKLIELLRDLSRTDALKSVDARDGPELAKELKMLCSHADVSVKVAAMEAYARWGGEDARTVCMEVLDPKSTVDERLIAIKLLPKWKDTDHAMGIASQIASLIGRPGIESTRAKMALEEIGGVAAERAALGLLLRAEDNASRLIALTILEKVGGDEAMHGLRAYLNQTILDEAIRRKTAETIEVIELRPRKKA